MQWLVYCTPSGNDLHFPCHFLFSIVQGADWYYGPTRGFNSTSSVLHQQPDYIKYSSLSASILAFIFLIAYLAFQVSFVRHVEEIFVCYCS